MDVRAQADAAKKAAEFALKLIANLACTLRFSALGGHSEWFTLVPEAAKTLLGARESITATLSDDVLRGIEIANYNNDTTSSAGETTYPTAHAMARGVFGRCAMLCDILSNPRPHLNDIIRAQIAADEFLRPIADDVAEHISEHLSALSHEWRRTYVALPDSTDRQGGCPDLALSKDDASRDTTRSGSRQQPAANSGPPVAYGITLGGPSDPIIVDGKQKPPLPTQQYRSVMLLIESYPAGVKLNEFPDTIGDPYRALKTLRKDSDFAREIVAPLRSGRNSPGYRLARPGRIRR